MLIRLLSCFMILSPLASGGNEFYGQRISIPADASDELKETATELARNLVQATTKEIETVLDHRDRGAIILGRSNLPGRGPEAFQIRSIPAREKLMILGNSDQAIRHGVYFYLEQLGFRWLLPNENWTIVPELASIRIDIDRIEEPAFRLRNFFGTGGFGGKLPVDPEMELQARWETWKQRNRLGGDIQLAGHAGEAFNHAHRETLEANPEFFAELDGKRQPWGVTTKLCTSNPELRKLFVEDRMAKMAQQIEQFPQLPQSMSVSVEPADGGDHCECADCLKIGTISDRVFFLANEVAKKLATEHPGRFANLYAYNQHAAPPNFSVEPNVFVLVAPYAFQRTGLPGDELVKAWAPRAEKLGIYDYWAIPDWANCLPTFSGMRDGPRKIRFWNEQGVTAYLGESSFSAGNVGLTWYIASRLLWNPTADEEAIIDEFFELAFGKAQAPMRRMIERWDESFLLSEHELALSFRDLDEARKLAPSEAVRNRIDEFVLYVEYLRLWRAYQESEDKTKAVDDLIRYLWRIYPTAMVHSFRMYQLIVYRYERSNAELLECWPQKDAEAPAWSEVTPITESETEEILAAGIRDFTPLDFEPRSFSRQLLPLHQPESLSEEMVSTPSFAGTHEFEFWIPEAEDSLLLQIRCGKRENYPGNLVVVFGPDEKEVFRQIAPSNGEWTPLRIPTEQSGNYQMTVSDQKIFFSIQAPRNLPFVVKEWKACPALPSKVYFQMPKDLERLAVYSESVVPVKLANSDGVEIPHADTRLFTIDVEPSQRAQIWQISNFKTYSPLRMLNAPNVFAFSPEGVMIPAE